MNIDPSIQQILTKTLTLNILTDDQNILQISVIGGEMYVTVWRIDQVQRNINPYKYTQDKGLKGVSHLPDLKIGPFLRHITNVPHVNFVPPSRSIKFHI